MPFGAVPPVLCSTTRRSTSRLPREGDPGVFFGFFLAFPARDGVRGRAGAAQPHPAAARSARRRTRSRRKPRARAGPGGWRRPQLAGGPGLLLPKRRPGPAATGTRPALGEVVGHRRGARPDLPSGHGVAGADGAVGCPAPGRHRRAPPRIRFGWPWQSITSGTTTNIDVGPGCSRRSRASPGPGPGPGELQLRVHAQRLEEHRLLAVLIPATFYAVGHASATFNLNPGPTWWKPSTGHSG